MRLTQKVIAVVGLVALVLAIGLVLRLRTARPWRAEEAYFSCSAMRTNEYLLRFSHDGGADVTPLLPLVGAIRFREDSTPLAAEADQELREVRLRFDEIAGLAPARADALRRAAEVPLYVVYRNGATVIGVYIDAALDLVDDEGMRKLLPFVEAFQYDALGASEWLYETDPAGKVEIDAERIGSHVRKRRIRFLAPSATAERVQIESSTHEFRLREDGSLDTAHVRERQQITGLREQSVTLGIEGEGKGGSLRALDAKAHKSCTQSTIAAAVETRSLRPLQVERAKRQLTTSDPVSLPDLVERLRSVQGDGAAQQESVQKLTELLEAQPELIAELEQHLLDKKAWDEEATLLTTGLAAVSSPEQATAMRELMQAYRQRDHHALEQLVLAQQSTGNVDRTNIDLLWSIYDDAGASKTARRSALLSLSTELGRSGDGAQRREYEVRMRERLTAPGASPEAKQDLLTALGNLGDAEVLIASYEAMPPGEAHKRELILAALQRIDREAPTRKVRAFLARLSSAP